MKSLICEWVTCRPAKELVLSKEKPIPYQPPLPPNEAPSGVDAAAGVTPVGLRPPFVTPAAAHSHPDCRGIPILIVALQAGPQLRWLSTGCCARLPPTELSAPASNRAAMSPVSGNVPQAPCDLSSKGGLLLLRVSSRP